MTELNKIPEISPDFANRVVAASRNVKQRQPMGAKALWCKLGAVLPVRPAWAFAMCAAVFAIGLSAGLETYTIAPISEIMDGTNS